MTDSRHADTGRGQCGQEAWLHALRLRQRCTNFKQMALFLRISVGKYALLYLSSCGTSTFCLHLYTARMIPIVLGICFSLFFILEIKPRALLLRL